ncbi:MAG: tetratricopeptide repeat protein [Thermodesulfobacteriota bacterium]
MHVKDQGKFVLAFSLICFLLLGSVAAWAISTEAVNLYERGRFEMDDGEYAAALKYFEEALKIEPDDVNIQIARGQALLKLGRLAEAEAQFTKLLTAGPAAREAALVELGAFYGQERQYAKAADYYSQAIAATPQRADLYLARGSIYMEMKDYARAEADFQRAIQTDAKLAASAKYHQAMLSHRQEDYASSKTRLDEALALKPEPALAKHIQELKASVIREQKAYKNWSITVNALAQYDDNVTLEAVNGPEAGPSGKSDASLGLNLQTALYFFNRRSGNAGAAYTFRSQGYRDHPDYDLLSHTGSLFYTANMNPWYFRVQGDASLYYVHGTEKLTTFSITPTLAYLLGPRDRIEMMAAAERRMRHEDLSNSIHYVVGGTYFHTLVPAQAGQTIGVTARLGGQHEEEHPDGDSLARYSINELKAGLSFPLPGQIEGDLGFGYALIEYEKKPWRYDGRKRLDNRLTFSARAGRALSDDFRIDIFWYHTFNNSNLSYNGVSIYDFQRNVYTLMFTGAF